MVYNNLLNKNISLRILHTFSETIVDGPGLRYSIYFSGCSHQCDGCHNMKSWNPLTGDLVNDEVLLSIVNEINSNDLLDGITISGGDPLYNPEDLYFILKYLKEESCEGCEELKNYFEKMQDYVLLLLLSYYIFCMYLVTILILLFQYYNLKHQLAHHIIIIWGS